ncbi:DUF6597 domain-containing transcriptional factor [Nonomuraea sp. NPDC050404]|uniref:DUF6597 domain-containing transcriptional factor n=1 Tax=Nonomuraea sp. NPDC050404 TaxID=3155783 RepID=UPI0033DD076F
MYAERPPSADLTDRVACGWHRISGVAYTQLVVPDACVDLIWGPDGLFVAGPDTGPMPSTVGAGDTLVGIRFRPGAAGDFFGLPLQELRDRRVPLTDLPILRPLVADLMGRQLMDEPDPMNRKLINKPDLMNRSGLADRRLSERGLMDRPELSDHHRLVVVEERLRAMQDAVRRHLATGRSGPADPAAPAIAAALRQGRSVAEVAWDLGYSERHLQRRSLHSFGYAPKTLQRIVRFQHALRLARAGAPLAEVAVTAGYTDQAHLANDVKRLSGLPMSRLISPARVRQPA